MSNSKKILAYLSLVALSATISGCATGGSSSIQTAAAMDRAFQGSIHGGQQPVSGATIALYAASTASYGASLQNILKNPVTTDATGSFSLTGDYTCTAGQQMYLIATGGNPGAGTNPNLAIMAALGDCSQLTATTFISANEVTTVASVFALAPFMNGPSSMGTSPTNVSGLARAFASVHKLANTATGQAPGDLLPAGAVAPTAEINTLANILGSCINSKGDTGSGSPCHSLFAAATPAGGTAPTDTIAATLAIARNPTLNVSALYVLSSAAGPFQPSLAVAPPDWTLAVNYSGPYHQPSTTTVDFSGNIWVANAGNNTLQVLAQTGSPAANSPLSGNGLSAPTAVAIDVSGNAWVANSTGTSLSAFTGTGSPFAGSPFTPTGLYNPGSLAFDVAGNLWIANTGNNSVLEVSSAGIVMGQTFGSVTPQAIAIDPK